MPHHVLALDVDKNKLKMLIENDKKLHEISVAMAIPSVTLCRYIKRYGLDKLWSEKTKARALEAKNRRRKKEEGLKQKIVDNKNHLTELHKKRVAKVKVYLSKGYSKKDIRKKLGISKAALNRLIAAHCPREWMVNKKAVIIAGQGLRCTVGDSYIESLTEKQLIDLKLKWGWWVRKKQSCRSRNIKFDLPFKLIDFPTHCPVTKELLCYRKTKRAHSNNATFDRLNPAKGYTLSNVRVISFRANLVKGNATIEELNNVIRYMKEAETQKSRFWFNPKQVRWRKYRKITDHYGNVPRYGTIGYSIVNLPRSDAWSS